MQYMLPAMNSSLPVRDGRQERLLGYAAWTQPWANFFSQTYTIVSDVQNAGTSALRPTTNLYIGKPYFDTSLGANGKPIWLGADAATWITADGNAA